MTDLRRRWTVTGRPIASYLRLCVYLTWARFS